MEIVGIVEDIREGPLDAAIPPVLYLPFNQSTGNYLGVVVRTSQAEASLLPALWPTPSARSTPTSSSPPPRP